MGMNTISGWNDNQDDWHKQWRNRDRSRYAPRVVTAKQRRIRGASEDLSETAEAVE